MKNLKAYVEQMPKKPNLAKLNQKMADTIFQSLHNDLDNIEYGPGSNAIAKKDFKRYMNAAADLINNGYVPKEEF